MAGQCDLTQQREGNATVTVGVGGYNPDTPRPNADTTRQQAPAPSVKGTMIRAARADLVTLNASTVGRPQTIMQGNENRCYFMIQNTGNEVLRLSFGTEAGPNTGLRMPAGFNFEAPIAPTNSISIYGPNGGTFTVIYAND